MSDQALKTRPEEPIEEKTYEKVKAVELTKTEKEKVSREMLLGWLEAKQYEKLKGLQDQLIRLTVSEREEFKKKVIENTRKELESHKELTEAERNKRAEKFAETLIKVVDGIGNVKTVIEDFEKDINEENLFHHYIESVGGVVGALNLRKIKENEDVKKFLASQPGIEEDLDKAIDSGDYDSIKEVLLKVPQFQGQGDKIDVILDFIIERPTDSKGIEAMIGSALGWVGGLPKKLFETFKQGSEVFKKNVYKPAAKEMKVDYSTLRSVGALTLTELMEKNRIFQKYRHLLEDRIKITRSEGDIKKLEKKLKVIDETKIITENMQRIKEAYGSLVYQAYEKRIKALQAENKISNDDAIRILSELDLGSVTIETFLPLVRYEKDKDKDQDSYLYSISQVIIRKGKIKRALKFVGGDLSIPKAHGLAGIHRLFERNVSKFKKTFTKFPDGKKLTEMFDDLSRKAGSYNPSPKEIDRVRRTRAYLSDVKGHDDLLRMYYESSQYASEILSKEAQKVMNVGKQLDDIFASGFDVKKVPADVLGFLYAGDTIPESLGKGAHLKKGKILLTPAELQRAYAQKLIDVRMARDTAQESFAILSSKMKDTVMGKFNERWVGSMEIQDVKKAVTTEAAELKKYIQPGRRAAYYGSMALLPTIAIGVPVIDAVRGKARYRDIKYDVFDAAINFCPVLGTLNDFKQAFSGKTTSGRTLGFKEQVMSFGFGVVGAISDAAWVLGGLGGAMRAGLGSLRAGSKLAHVGKLAKSARGISAAEDVTFIQKIGMKVGGMFSGLSTAKRMESYAESASKIQAFNYLKVNKQLEGIKGFDKVTDLATAEKFAESLKGTNNFDAAKQYVEMMKHTNGIDYYKSLSNSFGFANEAPGFIGIRTKFHEAMNYVRGKTLAKGPQVARLKEMEKTADVYQAYKIEKAEALANYQKAVQDGKGVDEALKNLRNVESKLASGAVEYAKVQEEIFSTAEKISRTHLLATKVARYATYGGFAGAAYWMLTGKTPTVQGMVDTAGKVASPVYKVGKQAAMHSVTIHDYEAPVDSLVEKAIEDRASQIEFAKKIKEIEDSHATDKKKQIEAVCAKNWNQDFVRVWAIKHKDKIDIKKIMDEARKIFIPVRGKIQQMIAGGGEFVGEGGDGGGGGAQGA